MHIKVMHSSLLHFVKIDKCMDRVYNLLHVFVETVKIWCKLIVLNFYMSDWFCPLTCSYLFEKHGSDPQYT